MCHICAACHSEETFQLTLPFLLNTQNMLAAKSNRVKNASGSQGHKSPCHLARVQGMSLYEDNVMEKESLQTAEKGFPLIVTLNTITRDIFHPAAYYFERYAEGPLSP